VLKKLDIKKLEQLPPEELKKYGLTKADLGKLKIMADPIRWLSANLRDPENPKKPLKLRSMQREIVALGHPKITIRASRRTGKSIGIAARIIYQAFTESNTPILLVAPYLSQVNEIFEDIEHLTQDSPTVCQTIVRQIQSPFRLIEFSNGSVIKGMCAGSTPGRRGSSLRGQGAKYIYVDEFDYMDEESLKALFMIMKTRVDTELFVTGTPSGARSWFYTWCIDAEKHGFMTRHYSKEHIPNWTAEDDLRARIMLGEAGYMHEVLAEFADESTQVFPSIYIDQCMYSYNWKLLKYNPDREYGIGVDWNSAATGCHIVIMEYLSNENASPIDTDFLTQINAWRAMQNKEYQEKLYEKLEWNHLYKKLRFFRHIAVAGEPFAQHDAVEKIIETYLTYQPKFIWVDQGHGEVQVELLLKWALDHGDNVLPKILKACNFSGTIELPDPIHPATKIKKRFKPYMVQAVQRCLEEASFVLPMSEDEQAKLVGQFRGYMVEKQTAAKEPVFSSGNDHILDAAMLAILGFEHNFGLLARRTKIGTARIEYRAIARQPETFPQDESKTNKPGISFGRLRTPPRRWTP